MVWYVARKQRDFILVISFIACSRVGMLRAFDVRDMDWFRRRAGTRPDYEVIVASPDRSEPTGKPISPPARQDLASPASRQA